MRTLLLVLLLTSTSLPTQRPPANQQAGQQARPVPVVVEPPVGNPTHDIRVVKMPPKDSYDRWSLGAAMAVAGVGILGVLVGVGTLIYVARQAREMRLQREAMRAQADLMSQQLAEMKVGSELARQNIEAAKLTAKASEVSATAAERSAEAALTQIKAMKDQERARLVIKPLGDPQIGPPQPIAEGLRPMEAMLHLINEGASKAFNVRTYAVISAVSKRAGGRFEIGFQQDVPSTMGNTTGDRVAEIHVFGFGLYGNAVYPCPILTDEKTATALTEGRMFLQISGLLCFTDIFEDSHEIPFKFIWVSQGDDVGHQWRNMSTWFNLPVTEEEVDEDRTWDVSGLEEDQGAGRPAGS